MIPMKRGDTAQKITDNLKVGGQYIPLNQQDTVILIMILRRKMPDGTLETVVRGGSAAITDIPTSEVTYTVVDADVEFVREGDCEWEITFQSGKKLTVPTEGYIPIKIGQDLNPPPPAP